MSTVFLVLLMTKHIVGDYPLQTVWMLGKGKSGREWILPLASHCAVHMVMSGMIIACFNPAFLWLSVVEFFIHFVVDRIKATYRLPAGVWSAEEKGKNLKKYHTAYGVDQYCHYLTYALMTCVMFGGIT